MRAVYITAAVILIASLLTSWWLYKRNAELIAEREAAEIATMQTARDADNSSFATFERNRNTILQESQEKRDALNSIDPTDTVADVLRRCRDGLRKGSASADGGDASRSSDGTLRQANSAE